MKTTHARNPSEIPWKALGVEYLCESTGAFLTEDSAKPHVDAGVSTGKGGKRWWRRRGRNGEEG